MNPNIARLATMPRGKKWRSRLIPYTEEIRMLRESGESYAAIADLMAKKGLNVSGGAIQNFVKVRACGTRIKYVLPKEVIHDDTLHGVPAAAMQASSSRTRPSIEHNSPQSLKIKHVFNPQAREQRKFEAADLAVNDPFKDSPHHNHEK